MTVPLRDLVSQLNEVRALVVGDVMLDRYVSGAATRMSQEAPVPVLRVDQEDVRPGGAACVAAFLRGLGASVSVAGVTGDDHAGRTLRKVLTDEAIDTDLLLTDASRPTTQKDRFIGRAADRHGQQILRVDYESTAPISCEFKRPLRHQLSEAVAAVDVVVIADYAKGVCSQPLLDSVTGPARQKGIPVLVDPGRGNPLEWYRGVSILKPNRVEAEQLSGKTVRTPETALDIAGKLRERCNAENVVVTLDQDGCVLVGDEAQTHLPTKGRSVYDITGAGDMFIAMLALGVASGLSVTDAARLGNIASGLEVERSGTSAISRAELELAIAREEGGHSGQAETLASVKTKVADARQHGHSVVFTNGCFDLLHIGHVSYLQEAAQLGHLLIVAINSDESVRRLKGTDRPIVSERDRAGLLGSLSCVDHVVIFDEDTPHRLLSELQPDVLVKGGTYSVDEVVGKEVVEAYGGEVVVTDRVEGISTTAFVNAIREGP